MTISFSWRTLLSGVHYLSPSPLTLLNVEVEWLACLLLIHEVPGSFLRLKFDWFNQLFFLNSDDSLGYEFPFVLKAVQKDGSQCAWCPWYRFCRGCRIQCCDAEFNFGSSHLAIDWDPTALHLRYQTSQERVRLDTDLNEKWMWDHRKLFSYIVFFFFFFFFFNLIL